MFLPRASGQHLGRLAERVGGAVRKASGLLGRSPIAPACIDGVAGTIGDLATLSRLTEEDFLAVGERMMGFLSARATFARTSAGSLSLSRVSLVSVRARHWRRFSIAPWKCGRVSSEPIRRCPPCATAPGKSSDSSRVSTMSYCHSRSFRR